MTTPFTLSQRLRDQQSELAKAEAWYFVDSAAFRRRYDTAHIETLLREAAEALEAVDSVILFVCRCGDEFASVESFARHRAMAHEPVTKEPR